MRYPGGADDLPQQMADHLPAGVLARSAPVGSIELNGRRVRLTCQERELDVDQVVIAVPPALALADIRISPALPPDLAKLARATPVWMGAVSKIVAVYPGPFWREQGLAGAAVSKVGPMSEIHDMSGPDGQPAALFGFAVSPPGAGASDSDALARSGLAQLVRLFGPKAANPEHILVQDWSRERFTSPPDVHALMTYATFGHPAYQTPALDGRLHWTSTETSTVNPGHVEGTLAAAARTTSAVLRRVSPESRKWSSSAT